MNNLEAHASVILWNLGLCYAPRPKNIYLDVPLNNLDNDCTQYASRYSEIKMLPSKLSVVAMMENTLAAGWLYII